jgi:peptide/nickel transport system substrate-binding protein
MADLSQTEGLEVLDGEGAEIRYLVFNLDLEPGKELAVRKAVAYTIDRDAIVTNVYEGTVEPLWSMVPSSFAGATENFKDVFGETPDVDAAAAELEDAGVSTPVDIEIWWTPSHYGDSSADEYTEIERALEDSGLFNVTLKSTEWEEYGEAAFTDQYPAYQLGWFPDYLDADNYLASFYASSTFLANHYKNDRVDELIATEKSSTDQDERIAAFEEIQQIAAEDVPIIPIWQGKQQAVVTEGITGVDETLDAAYIFRYWLVHKM